MFRTENITEFAMAYLGSASTEEPLASPLLGGFEGLPPILLQVGSTELLLDDSRFVHDKIQAAGGFSRLEVFEDLSHCWHMLDGIVPEARAALLQAVSFLSSNIQNKT